MRTHHLFGALGAYALAASIGCTDSGDDDPTPNPDDGSWQGQHVQTLKFADDDNSEVIKMLPDGTKAVLVASKTRKVTLLGVSTDGIDELRSANLFPDDQTESEFTHIDFDSQARFAAVARTLPITDADGTLTDCAGSLVFVDVSDSDTFGTIINEVPVGPMPDAVDISPDDGWVVTGDEKDAWSKCDLAEVIPTVTVIELPGADPAQATVRARINMVAESDEVVREPEQIIFSKNNDTVAATLQDSHEVLIFSLSAVLAGAGEDVVEVGSDTLTTVRLPDREDGAEPWPDGLNVFTDGAGEERFVVAGEFNDTIHILAMDGTVLSSTRITEEVVPGDFPRVIDPDENARFRPDSVATFNYGGVPYAAFSLKHSGAVGVWNISDPADIFVASMVKIGQNEMASSTEESSLGTEGITAHDSGLIITANEDESSASLLAPLQ